MNIVLSFCAYNYLVNVVYIYLSVFFGTFFLDPQSSSSQ